VDERSRHGMDEKRHRLGECRGELRQLWPPRLRSVGTAKAIFLPKSTSADVFPSTVIVRLQDTDITCVKWQKESTEPPMVRAAPLMVSMTDMNAERMEFTTSKEVTVAPTFEDMHLKENLLRGIYAYGYESPSAVQSRAIVQICKGRDTIAQAQSGTGKTATFAISILQVLETSVRETQGEGMWARL